MTAEKLRYPVLTIYKGMIEACRDVEELCTTTRHALKSDYYSLLLIVDSGGKEYSVRETSIRHGVGAFFGYNIFLNRTVRIDISVRATGAIKEVGDVRKLVMKDFKNWHGWESREDFNALRERVLNCKETKEILRAITERGG